MPIFELEVPHKKQTKANDCWYACIQMLRSFSKGGKTKPSTQQHTARLHSGILGHRLHSDPKKSKHFVEVLRENGLKRLGTDRLYLENSSLVYQLLVEHGPIMIGGGYGKFGPFKDLGHFVVISGVNTEASKYRINDPAETGSAWRSAKWINDRWWKDDNAIVVDPNANPQ